jgi:uncharacterized repeat protein (TIGR03803 family)
MRDIRSPASIVAAAFCVLAASTLTACRGGDDDSHDAAPQTQVLHSFGDETPPIVSPSGLVLGKDGNFYGTASGGGHFDGVIFKLTPAGVASVVHSFDRSTGDGGSPSGLILGGDGNFYGTTIGGGANGFGTVFKITPDGSETVLYSFRGYPSDGGYAATGLVQASDGNFYGTTEFGGTNNKGTVFKVTPSGLETPLYSFGSNANDVAAGFSPLVEGSDGSFYGVSANGGASNRGAVFKISPEGIETLVHSFTGGPNDGSNFVAAGLLKSRDGNFYGVTTNGGAANGGVIFKLTPAGVESIVYSFGVGANPGSKPSVTLVEDSLGNLYGGTRSGGYPRTVVGNQGASLTGQSGTIFEITAAGKAVQLSNFGPTDADGTNPAGPSILGQDGNLYGVTNSGGANGAGVFYKITR